VTIVGNLIDNALDAVAQVDDPSSRRVAFDAKVEEAEAPALASDEGAAPGTTPQRYAVLDVSDTGPGLPPGAVEDAFRRGWSTKEQGVAGRRGIGLALVAQTVDRLGGQLAVSGPPGARFTVRLPVPDAVREGPGAAEATRPSEPTRESEPTEATS
jgi:sensor histidine kinase regulating citrate/malate metabolism